MSVLKQYNTGTSTWETIVVGAQGEPGVETGSVAPTNTNVLWMDTADAGSQVAVPSGGNPGQVLAKTSATDYATAWTDTVGQGNAIINGAFDFWQRGATVSWASSTSGYLADRWWLWSSATTTTGTLSKQTFTAGNAIPGYEAESYLRIATTTISGANIHSLWQKIEDVRTFAGQTVTLSFWAKADATRAFGIRQDQLFGTGGSSETVSSVAVFNATNSWQRFTVTFVVPSISGKTIGAGSSMNILFDIPTVNGSTFDIWGVQLEQGSYATPFKRAGGTMQGELAACQRYYFRHVGTSGVSNYPQLFSANWESSAAAWGSYRLPTTMRVIPSFSTSGGNYQLNHGVIGTLTLDPNQSSPSIVGLGWSNGSSATAGYSTYVRVNGNAASYIEFNAEL